MKVTRGLRDVLTEMAESHSGAERRRFMADTLNKLQLEKEKVSEREKVTGFVVARQNLDLAEFESHFQTQHLIWVGFLSCACIERVHLHC